MQEARFGLAWCMQLCGDAMREACAALPDDAGSWSAERQARHAAAGMYRRAAAAYREVLAPSGQVREDAATNCGNTLCSLAEALQECAAPTPADPAPGDISVCGSGTLASPAPPSAAAAAAAAEAAACYREAKLCYEAALQQEPEDAAGWSNLADCLMAAAQLLAEGTVPSWQVREGELLCRRGVWEEVYRTGACRAGQMCEGDSSTRRRGREGASGVTCRGEDMQAAGRRRLSEWLSKVSLQDTAVTLMNPLTCLCSSPRPYLLPCHHMACKASLTMRPERAIRAPAQPAGPRP